MLHMALITAILLGPVDTAQTYFEAGQYNAAIETLIAAHRGAPNDGAIHYWLERSILRSRMAKRPSNRRRKMRSIAGGWAALTAQRPNRVTASSSHVK